MQARVFSSSDGELLMVPQEGKLRIVTELGCLDVSPLEIAVIPRGVRFRVELAEPVARGYVLENYGSLFRLPELGPIGANGLAAPRDFEMPAAQFEDRAGRCEVVQKFAGRLWTTELEHSPLDVVAWHGNLAPYRYDLKRFNTLNTVSFDHPDPSIFTVLTSPSEVAGHGELRFRDFSAPLDGGRGYFPSALVSSQRDERVHGTHRGHLRCEAGRIQSRRARPCTIA